MRGEQHRGTQANEYAVGKVPKECGPRCGRWSGEHETCGTATSTDGRARAPPTATEYRAHLGNILRVLTPAPQRMR
jgi:hypothetical protein